jgi:hypothetical protein
MAISEDIQEDDDDTSPVPESPENYEINPPSDPPEVEPIISLNALTRLLCPPNPQANRLHQAPKGHHLG